MSDYSEIWDELHKDQTAKEVKINNLKDRLISELSIVTMIRIMFTSFINDLRDSEIEKIAERYLEL